MRIIGKFVSHFFGEKSLPRLSFPMGILSNFDCHYALYDVKGDVHFGTRTLREALKKHKETGLYIARIYD